MSTGSAAESDGAHEGSTCWCCGQGKQARDVLRLGARPEAVVCLDCAMHLRRRAREQQAGNPVLRQLHAAGNGARKAVMAKGLHKKPVIGPVLRFINRRLPY